ncbi:hypothetical protein ILUMI_20099, partial [Ignelater luminosus]
MLKNESPDDEEELEDPYCNSGLSDEDYCPTENDVEDSSQSGEESDVPNMNSNTNDLEDNNETSSNLGESNSSTGISESDEQVVNNTIWFNNNGAFIPRLVLPQQKSGECLLRELNELDLFLKLFPKSLIMYPAQCSNMRLEIFEKESKKKRISTDYHEIIIVLEVSLMMSYNRVPAFNHCWSKNESLGNTSIKKQFLDIAANFCWRKCASIVPRNLKTVSIDESMAKFKGRSSIKQYLSLKPTKRGIKIWVRSDSSTGYVYDLKIYAGKDTEATSGALGERIVKKETKTPFLPFVIQVAEGLVSLGRSKAAVKSRSATSLGRPPKVKKQKTTFNVGDHLPSQGRTHRRCFRCSSQFRNETRTYTQLFARKKIRLERVKTYIATTLNKWKKKVSDMGIKLNNRCLYTLRFVDDPVVIANDKDDIGVHD